jgi:hypothetical protein
LIVILINYGTLACLSEKSPDIIVLSDLFLRLIDTEGYQQYGIIIKHDTDRIDRVFF